MNVLDPITLFLITPGNLIILSLILDWLLIFTKDLQKKKKSTKINELRKKLISSLSDNNSNNEQKHFGNNNEELAILSIANRGDDNNQDDLAILPIENVENKENEVMGGAHDIIGSANDYLY